MRIALLTMLILAQSAFADVLDDIKANIPARVIPWSAGVRGGITNHPVQHSVTDYGAVGDGVTECYSAFTNGIARTTNGGALWIPNGTYAIGTNITISYTNRNITIRGESATNTVLIMSGSEGNSFFVLDGSAGTVLTSVSSAVAGQSNITVGSASGLVVGRYARIVQTNDPAVVFGDFGDPLIPWQGQMFQITNISGTTITINRPVYWTNYQSSLGLAFEQFNNAASYVGMENFKLVGNNSAELRAIQFVTAANCWLRNICTTNVQYVHINVVQTYACEFRDSRHENHSSYDSTSRYSYSIAQTASDNLVENNIMLGNNLALSLIQGANGNVVAYNFCENGFGSSFPSNQQTKGGLDSHGQNAHYNLYEGNVTPWVIIDNFWGSSHRETIFRNWARRQSFYNTTGSISDQGKEGIGIGNTNYHMTVVGNIIGLPRDSGDGDPGFLIAYNYRLGTQWTDPTVTNTLFNHRNFEFKDSSTTSSNGYSSTLPASFYLTSKPSWFGNLAWPAIGPDVNTADSITNSAVIPAQARWLGESYFGEGAVINGRIQPGFNINTSRRGR